MLEKSNSQYDSFLFWRQPIPALDLSELEDLGTNAGKLTKGSQGKVKKTSQIRNLKYREPEAELTEYSSFNYWRAPIANIESLLEDLLL